MIVCSKYTHTLLKVIIDIDNIYILGFIISKYLDNRLSYLSADIFSHSHTYICLFICLYF